MQLKEVCRLKEKLHTLLKLPLAEDGKHTASKRCWKAAKCLLALAITKPYNKTKKVANQLEKKR